MNRLSQYFGDWLQAWNRFWFVKRSATLLGVMRILVGSLLFYTHTVWMLNSADFFGPDGMLPAAHRQLLFDNSFAWSHLDWVTTDGGMLVLHIAGLIVIAMFTIGLFTRITSVLTCLIVISYANRATGAQFGLDQISAFLAVYLAIGNSGGAFSVDNRIGSRRSDTKPEGPQSNVVNNVAIRLIQVHMCIVYLFAGCGKLQGDSWWNGDAIWGALASFEYQTMDLTWLAEHMWLVNVLTLTTLAWEVAYPFLIWPRLTRPIMLAVAFCVHVGIGLAMGMVTFGLIMVFGNIAFVPEGWFAREVRSGAEE